MRQRLANPKLKWWQGALMILGIIALLMAGQFAGAAVSYFFESEYSYTVASVGFWLFGGMVALCVVRAFILEYEYTLDARALRIDRYYSTKPRFAYEIVLKNIAVAGALKDVEDKYPDAHKTAFLRARNKTEELALAYSENGKIKIIRLQPDDKIREKLMAAGTEK